MTPLNSGWATLEEKMGFRQEMVAFINAIINKTKPRTVASDSIKTHVLLNRVLAASGLPEMEA
jgi:virulence factor